MADIRFAYILKALCFFYYCFFLPFIWLGKKIWWCVFKDSAPKKEAAEKAVLNRAKKKGKLEKYGIIDLAAELKNIEEERNQLRGGGGDKQQQDAATSDQNSEMECSVSEYVKQIVAENVVYENLKGGGDKNDTKSKDDKKKKQSKADKDKNSKAMSNRKGREKNVQLKKEDQSVGTGENGTDKNVKLKKEKQLEGERGMKNENAKLKEGQFGEGVKPNSQMKKKSVELKREKQLGGGVRPSDQKYERRKEQPLKKESPGYREGSRAQERPTGKNATDSGMKSSKQRSTSRNRDDKEMREKTPRGPGKSPVKTKELKTPQSVRSKAASHGHAQQGKLQSSVKSEKSLSPAKRELSHASKGSEGSITKLDDDTITKDDKSGSANDGRQQDSHTSLASVDHRNDKPDSNLSAEKSMSSQEGNPRRKASVDEIKSDMSSKNSEHERSNASPVSDPDHGSKQPLGAISPHHSEEIKSIPSDKSGVAEPVLSQHSDMAMKSHHSEATQRPLSHHSIGTPPRTGRGEISSDSDNDMKRSISRESSVRVQRVSSDQFSVRHLSEGRISVVMQSSHHLSRDSDTQAAHSQSEAKFSKRHQSSSSVERRLSVDSVNALISPKSSGSRISMYSDLPLSASSFSQSNSSNTATTRSSSNSTNNDSKKSISGSAKSISTSSATSSSSSRSATGTSSSSHSSASGKTSLSSSDLTSKSGESHSTLSNQMLDISSIESHISGMVPSISASEHSENFDEPQESESSSSSSQHSEAESRSETTHSEEFHDDEHTSTSGSEHDSSAESSSEITESHTSTSSSQESATTYSSSYSGSEGSLSRTSSESGSSTKSMSSESASSVKTSHSE